MASEGKRFRTLRHVVAVQIHDKIADGEKVKAVEDLLSYFLVEACTILLGVESLNGKDIS